MASKTLKTEMKNVIDMADRPFPLPDHRKQQEKRSVHCSQQKRPTSWTNENPQAEISNTSTAR